jgi:hypothetical protein
MTAQIVTANRLGDGAVVYLTRAGDWSERIDEAEVACGKDDAKALLARAETPEQRVRAVGPYLMAVTEETGRPQAASIRERIRALGPSVRIDLGRQAGPA